KPDQLVASDALHGVRRQAGADRDGPDVLELERGDALDDRGRSGVRLLPVQPRHQDRELVAAEPERLAALAQAPADLAEHTVSDGMAEAVVDPLEVVDVHEAERQRLALLLRLRELAL